MQCLLFEAIHKQSNYGLSLKLVVQEFANIAITKSDLELYESAFDSFSPYISKNEHE